MKKNILFILPDLHAGGAERIVTTIANALPRSEFNISLLLLRKEGAYLDFLQKDIEIIDINTPRIRHSLWPILKEIRKRKPNIVFSGFGEVNAYISLFIKLFPNTKFIARETNVVSQHVTRGVIKFFYKFYNNYHQIVCQSDDMQEDLWKNFGIRKQKTVKINNPVDFDFINSALLDAKKPSEYLDGYKNIVAVGNLSYRKGFDNLLKVMNELKTHKILLHILGDGVDRQLLHEMKNNLDLDHVVFHGIQKNPYPYLKFADLFILSSRYEGFPNVLLEAGACGTYALANDCKGGIHEIIQPKINGEIARIEDHQTFASKILKVLEEERHEESIKNSIQSRFSKETILQKYYDIFHKL